MTTSGVDATFDTRFIIPRPDCSSEFATELNWWNEDDEIYQVTDAGIVEDEIELLYRSLLALVKSRALLSHSYLNQWLNSRWLEKFVFFFLLIESYVF